MNKWSKKVSYIKGLADGLDLDELKPESKIILKMLDVMDEMAAAMDEMAAEVQSTNDLVDDMAEDMVHILNDWENGKNPLDDDELDDDDLFDNFDIQGDLYEMECPNCHEDVMIEFDMINDDNEIICPNCHKEIPLEFDFEEDFEEED